MKKFLILLSLLLLLPLLLAGYLLPEVLRPLPDFTLLKSDTWLAQRFSLENWIPLEMVSRPAVQAVLVSEDDTFYEHEGIAPDLVKQAVLEDLSAGRFKRGASTLTQQVVRNVFLEREKTLKRKVREWVLARALEKVLEKDRILEIYLNIAEFGRELRGIGPASDLYFGKAPMELTPKEGAFLAMLLPSPARYSSSFENGKLTPYAQTTVDRILVRVHRSGELTSSQLEAELARPLSFEAEAAKALAAVPAVSTPAVPVSK